MGKFTIGPVNDDVAARFVKRLRLHKIGYTRLLVTGDYGLPKVTVTQGYGYARLPLHHFGQPSKFVSSHKFPPAGCARSTSAPPQNTFGHFSVAGTPWQASTRLLSVSVALTHLDPTCHDRFALEIAYELKSKLARIEIITTSADHRNNRPPPSPPVETGAPELQGRLMCRNHPHPIPGCVERKRLLA